MSSYLLNSANIKPDQWGSPADIQYAVKENAGRIYGINPDNIALAMPMWEMAGNRAYGQSKNNIVGAIGTSLKWQANGLKGGATYDDANNIIDCGTIIDPRTWSGITIIYSGNMIDQAAYPSICTNMLSEAYYGNFNFSYESSYIINWRPGNNESALSYSLGVSTRRMIAVTWIKNSTAKIYVNGQEKASGDKTNGWLASNYTTQINGYYRGAWRTSSLHYNFLNIFSVALTANQVASMYDRPWGLYEPVSRPVYFFQAAVGGLSIPVARHHYQHNIRI